MKILDINGLQRLWARIKERFDYLSGNIEAGIEGLMNLCDDMDDRIKKIEQGKEDKNPRAFKCLRFKGFGKLTGGQVDASVWCETGDILCVQDYDLNGWYFIYVGTVNSHGQPVNYRCGLPEYQDESLEEFECPRPHAGILFYNEDDSDCGYYTLDASSQSGLIRLADEYSVLQECNNLHTSLRPTKTTPTGEQIKRTMMPGSKVVLRDGKTYIVMGYQVAAVQVRSNAIDADAMPDLLVLLCEQTSGQVTLRRVRMGGILDEAPMIYIRSDEPPSLVRADDAE